MIDKNYWGSVINNLIDVEKANWAAHAIASNLEILDELLLIANKDKLIANCLLSYSIDFSAQPYLDDILTKFSIKDLISVYKNLDSKPIQTAGALMWLLEDIDSEFSWAL